MGCLSIPSPPPPFPPPSDPLSPKYIRCLTDKYFSSRQFSQKPNAIMERTLINYDLSRTNMFVPCGTLEIGQSPATSC